MSHRLSGVPVNLMVAIFILFSIVIFTFTLVFVTVIVPGYRLTTSFKVAYNIANTVVATVLSRYASGEIQKQWLRQINHEISDVQYHLHHNPRIMHRWRAVLGINTFKERIATFKSTALPQLSFVFTGLITAAVVAAVTLTDTTCHSDISPPRIHSGADNRCTKMVPNNNTERLSPLWEFRTFWNKDDGSAYFATTNLGCPSWSGAQFMGSINTNNPAHVAYSRNGVGIKGSAIGTPEIFYTDFPDIVEPSEGMYGHKVNQSMLRTVSQCLPIMATNPVKCRPGGTVDWTKRAAEKLSNDKASYYSVNVDAGGCNFTQANAEDPNGSFGVMVSRFCPADNYVGKGTVAMGATGIISLTLAASIGDKEFLAKHADSYEAIKAGVMDQNLTYAVSCDVDVQPTIKWRTLTLELQQGTLTTTPSYSKLISGADGCESTNDAKANWTLGNGYAGGAAAALVAPLSEGRYWNGMTNTIFNQALNTTGTSDRYSTAASWQQLIRTAPYGFNQSTNALEDVLGLTTGITMSQMSTQDSMRGNSPLTDSVDFHAAAMGHATFACTRVGSGNRSAILFTLPPLLAMLTALYLIFTVPRKPTSFKTSRLEDLVGIGMATERELQAAYRRDHLRQWESEQVLVGMTKISKAPTPMGMLFPPPLDTPTPLGTPMGTPKLPPDIPPPPPEKDPFADPRDVGGEKALGLQELRAIHQPRKHWE